MTGTFQLTLDTTGPAAVGGQINGGAARTNSRDVTLAPTTTDPNTTGYQIKIWGSVDLAADPNIQDTEANSTWVTMTAAMAVRLSTGDGAKALNWRLRDDLNNPSSTTGTASIILDTVAPVVTIDAGPAPTRISKQAGKRTSTVTWHADSDLQAYKVKVVPSVDSLENAGAQIGTTNGSTNVTGGAVAAAAQITTSIDGADYETATGGDGTFEVKVFVQDLAGNWSVL